MAEVKHTEPHVTAPHIRAKTSQSARSKPQSSPRAQRPSTRHMERCPLTDPNLPPVGEVEHLVERCYCFLCNCGKHVCPGASRRKTEFVKSMYATNYRVEYYRKHGDPSKPLYLTSYSSNRLPMDLLTIKQRDFQPYKIEPAGDPQPPAQPRSVQFVSRSSYQTNYPNWGPNEVIRVNRPWYPYRGDQVKLDTKTTYSENFGKGSPNLSPNGAWGGGEIDEFGRLKATGSSAEQAGGNLHGQVGGSGNLSAADQEGNLLGSMKASARDNSAPGGLLNRNLRRTGGPFGTGREFYGQTTTYRAYRPFDHKQAASKEPRPNESFVPLQSPGSYLKTIYRADYVPKEIRMRPMKSKSQAALT